MRRLQGAGVGHCRGQTDFPLIILIGGVKQHVLLHLHLHNHTAVGWCTRFRIGVEVLPIGAGAGSSTTRHRPFLHHYQCRMTSGQSADAVTTGRWRVTDAVPGDECQSHGPRRHHRQQQRIVTPSPCSSVTLSLNAQTGEAGECVLCDTQGCGEPGRSPRKSSGLHRADEGLRLVASLLSCNCLVSIRLGHVRSLPRHALHSPRAYSTATLVPSGLACSLTVHTTPCRCHDERTAARERPRLPLRKVHYAVCCVDRGRVARGSPFTHVHEGMGR